MKTSGLQHDPHSDQWKDWHILTVAETGFSMLDIYVRHKHGIDIKIINKPAKHFSARNESGSLYPEAPINAIPRHFFRDIPEDEIKKNLYDFKHHLCEFIKANGNIIGARKRLMDFHVSHEPLAELFLDATERIFRDNADENEIDEIILFV